LDTGRSIEALLATNAQAKTNGRGLRRSRVTMVKTMGVNMSAVESLEKKAVTTVPRPNITRSSLRPSPWAMLMALAAHQSKKPAWSATALITIKPNEEEQDVGVGLQHFECLRRRDAPGDEHKKGPQRGCCAFVQGLGRHMTRARPRTKMPRERSTLTCP